MSIYSTSSYKDPHKCLTPISASTIEENARKWLNIVRFTESGTVIQLQEDCEYRILEIINNKTLLKKYLGPYFRKYLFKYLQINQKNIIEIIHDALIGLCLDKKIGSRKPLNSLSNVELLTEIAKSGYEVGLFISHVTPILQKRNYQGLVDLELLVQTSKNLSVIVFSELDISQDKYKILVNKCSFLFDHLIKYPLYREPDVLQFIKFYEDFWNFSLSENKAREIFKLCGGYLWLVHQAIRNLRDNSNLSVYEACYDDLLLSKLETIWEKFTAEEKNIIRRIYLGTIEQIDTFRDEYGYLKNIGVIREISGKAELGLPLLTKIIEKEMKLDVIHTKGDQIMIGKHNLTKSLSTKERLFLSLLLGSKKRIIPRDIIAQTIWGERWEEKYSDWAIDVLAHRLRKKLKLIGVDEKLLKTVKKKGFFFG